MEVDDNSKDSNRHQSTSFLITIIHQNHHSYQGTIQWLEIGKTLHFRSELELLQLMHEGVHAHAPPQDLRSWQDVKQIQVM